MLWSSSGIREARKEKGVSQAAIAVQSPYVAQVKLLKDRLDELPRLQGLRCCSNASSASNVDKLHQEISVRSLILIIPLIIVWTHTQTPWSIFYKIHRGVSRLEGFVSNREQSYEDPIEELLYAVFVVSSENATVVELATTLQADLLQLQAAASFACRLGWAVKVIDPASVLQDTSIASSLRATLSDEDGSSASLDSANIFVDGDVSQQGDVLEKENNGPISAHARVAFVVDANITSYLMMGSVSPASSALLIGSIVGLIRAIFLIFGAKPLLGFMGVSSDSPMLTPAQQYLTLRSLGAPAVLLSLAMQGVFRGFKDTKTPLYATVAGDVTNIKLDPLFYVCFPYMRPETAQGIFAQGISVSAERDRVLQDLQDAFANHDKELKERASAVFALGTLLDMGGESCRDGVGVDEDCDDDDTEHGQLSPQELKTQVVGFCVEACVGIFWPSIMKMRSQYIPEEARSTIMNFFCIPLNIFVCIVLYNVNAFPVTVMFGMCSIFLFVACLLQRRLMVIAEKPKTQDWTSLKEKDTEADPLNI
uniref:Protein DETOXIFICATION n=1 Tax=Quercus lobata TaxID=97700 RepID=A0A7N2QZD5_QUELO